MTQDSKLTRQLAQAQEDVAANKRRGYVEHDASYSHAVQSRTSDNLSVRYRIYTERFPNLEQIVSFYFKGATIFDAIGLWEGNKENSAVIEILGTAAISGNIIAMSEDICAINNQSEILITSEPVKKYSVTRVSL